MAEAVTQGQEEYEIIYAGSSLILSEDGQVLVQNKNSGEVTYVNYFDIFPQENNQHNMETAMEIEGTRQQVDEPELEEEDDNGLSETSSTQNAKKWTDEETLLLIRTIEANFSDFNTNLKKNVYNNIATELSKMLKQNITGQQVDTKWKGLKIMYKKIKHHNETSGNAPKKWKFFNAINVFLEKRPEINPLATASSSSDKVNSNGTSSSSSETIPKHRKIKEDDFERRHKERLQRQDRFLDLFETMLKGNTEK